VRLGQFTVNLTHTIHRFSDGSVLATCEVWYPDFGVHGIEMWRAGTQGAQVGGCLIQADMDAPSYGFWRFDLQSTTSSRAAYNDPASPLNGSIAALLCQNR
jgi:hypothetical protein